MRAVLIAMVVGVAAVGTTTGALPPAADVLAAGHKAAHYYIGAATEHHTAHTCFFSKRVSYFGC